MIGQTYVSANLRGNGRTSLYLLMSGHICRIKGDDERPSRIYGGVLSVGPRYLLDVSGGRGFVGREYIRYNNISFPGDDVEWVGAWRSTTKRNGTGSLWMATRIQEIEINKIKVKENRMREDNGKARWGREGERDSVRKWKKGKWRSVPRCYVAVIQMILVSRMRTFRRIGLCPFLFSHSNSPLSKYMVCGYKICAISLEIV